MKSPKEYYLTRSSRERALVWIVISIAAVVLSYYSYVTVTSGNQEIANELKDKTLLLRKLQGLLSRKEIIKTEASGLESMGDINLINVTHEGQVLTEIPELLKKISAEIDIVIAKSDLTEKEVLHKAPLLVKLEIDLEAVNISRAEKIEKFLYLLENNEDFTCYIKDLDLKTLPGNLGADLSATLVTFALISK
ncbi:MAG: hypothetical protein ACYSTI_11515 [Planctomycetota bacterium]|jgi:hypothetical protein